MKEIKNTRILVVEDETIVAKDIQSRLKKFGYTVPTVAASGEEAINKAAETSPDLILMDIRLKGEIDGVEAARQIHDRFDVPVIYLTAYADDRTLARAKETEPSGYLIKPFKERELYTTIEIALARHKRERQLKEHEQWLATVLKSIGDAVIASDEQEFVTFMNPVAENLTGWKQEEAFGKKSTEVFNIANAETRNKIESPIIKALREGNVVSLPEQAILITKNGGEIPIDDSAAPIKDDKDKIMGVVLVFRDITESEQAKEVAIKQIKQEQQVAELEELNRLKDDFLNTVSHELRTPLFNMKMAIHMLQIASTPERGQRYLEILQTECDREIELINDLLDLQRLEALSSANFRFEAVNLQELLPNIVEPFHSRTQERNQTLHLHIPVNLPPLVSDSASLERILAELLNNACKYTPASGEIVLSVYYNSSPAMNPDSISATIFTISNQSEILAAELPHIFERFYRVHNADLWKQGGSGLGLALVQKLVEQLQGTIQVESSEGWTTFTLAFTNLVLTI